MAIALASTRQNLADRYGTLGNWIGSATGNPGSAAAPANESAGGAPAYARKQTTWSSGGTGSITGTAVTVDVPASTVQWILLASGASGATMIDAADVVDVIMSAQGQIVITPTYTQT